MKLSIGEQARLSYSLVGIVKLVLWCVCYITCNIHSSRERGREGGTEREREQEKERIIWEWVDCENSAFPFVT